MRFLILKSKSVCYNSTYYFADCLVDSLKKLGHESIIFELEGKSLAELQAITKEHFDAIFDFNSKVPQGLDDETMDYYLDEFDAPFFNYILDHPLYQHDNLKEKLKNYHVICLDYDHADYIRRYYPNIRSVLVLPIGAMPTEDLPVIPFSKRHYDLLFTGTYTDPAEVLHIIDNCDSSLARDMYKMIDALKDDFSLTCEKVFELLLQKNEVVLPPPTFAQYMQLYFLVDTYITAYVRDLVLRTLAKGSVTVDIFGHGWEKFKCEGKEHFRFHGTCDFKETFSKMADAKAVLNVMPWFKNGAHDRIFSAMRNGALAISDESGYLSKHFPEHTGLISYSLKDMDGFLKKVQDFLQNPAAYENIALAGQKFVCEHDTWEMRAAEIVAWIKNL
ncbi:MAG: glycosyltransferase [Roseburia sp.]